MATFTTTTAPGRVFSTREAFVLHQKSEWHRYNLRRKVAGLPMATEDEFEARRRAAQAASVRDAAEPGETLAHVKPSKRDQVLRGKTHKKHHKGGRATTTTTVAGATTTDQVASYRSSVAAAREAAEEAESSATIKAGDDPADEKEQDDDSLSKKVVTAEARAADSLFDAGTFATAVEALEYARSAYGLNVPEPTYVTDVEGLALYLCRKVKTHRVCLWCNRGFRSFHACQQHMIDRGHCKVAYETDDDLDELSPYYDFSASYDDYDQNQLDDHLGPDMTTDPKRDNDDAADDDDDTEWETDDEAVDDDDDDDEEENGADEREGTKTTAKEGAPATRRDVPRVSVLDSGELLVRKGGVEKIVGVRWLRRYYRQNFRLDDERDATAAVRGEQTQRLLALYKDAGALSAPRQPDDTRGFLARGLASQFNRRALSGVVKRDQRAQIRNQQRSQGMHSGRAKRNKHNMLIKNKVAGKNMGEGTGVHG